MFYGFDPLYLGIVLVFMLAGAVVQMKLKSVFRNNSNVPFGKGLDGRSVAEKMLRDNGIYDVRVTCVDGQLTDHYNPAEKTVNLSPDVYNGRSVTSASVAAHECGHAVQHASSYSLLELRTKLVPMVSFASRTMNFLFFAMIFLGFSYHYFNQALIVIIAAQAAITLFTLVTLPVEIDASRRALAWMTTTGMVYGEEESLARSTLRWAALTYLVAALAAVAQLFYFILRFSGRR